MTANVCEASAPPGREAANRSASPATAPCASAAARPVLAGTRRFPKLPLYRVAASALAAAALALPVGLPGSSAGGVASTNASWAVVEAASTAPMAMVPDSPGFGAERRSQLAEDVLHFPPADDESRIESGIYHLPVPLPWPPGVPANRTWRLTVPAGVPLFLLAVLLPDRQTFSTPPRVTVDGAAVPDLARYLVPGVHLPDGASRQELQALALVLQPFAPGLHTVQVECAGCGPIKGPWLSHVNAPTRTYTLDVVDEPKSVPPMVGSVAPAVLAIAPSANLVVDARPPALWLTGVPAPAASSGDQAGVLGPQGASLTAASEAAGAAGGIFQDRVLWSEALRRELPYRVYLPSGYDLAGEATASRRYPVLYLLHGLGASNRQWTNLGIEAELVKQDAQVIVVLPSGRTGYWVNHAGGGPRWGDYVTQDLVRHVDATYRTAGTRESRAIGGISMGGHGALQLGLNNRSLFSVIGAHSPALRTRDQAPAFLGGLLFAGDRPPTPEAYAQRDPITLVSRAASVERAAIWIDIGEQDRWAPRVRELHTALDTRKWEHVWRPEPGDHDGEYWSRRLPEYVRFYRESLQARPTTPV